jgi:8-oxo-dGTP pyrophosphatase MutT (NUDIX family)
VEEAAREMTIRQLAALPYRISASGQLGVLLITSRETRCWVLPKGNLMKGLKKHEAAAEEAFEEAGVDGDVGQDAIGRYRYLKRLPDGNTRNKSW